MDLIKVAIDNLKPNPANPPQRVDKSKASYRNLVSSISRAGQIEPITISSDNVIVNGTRRTTVMKELGNTEIYANKLNSNSAQLFDAMFLECNVVEKISGAQWAWRFLNKAPVPKAYNTILKRLKRIGGIGCIRRLVDLNKSPVSFNAGLSMFRNYTGKVDNKTCKQAIYWMLYVESAYKMKWLISEFVPVNLLVKAVKEKQKITMKGQWS